MRNLDTVYACQDIKDDVKMGVRSTAILFGSWIRPLLVLCGLMFVTMLAIAGYLNGQGPAYFIVSVGGTVIHLLWQYMTVDLDIPKSCWSKHFSSS
jgi:4-hydroxybenzoate polyprenyltransferase